MRLALLALLLSGCSAVPDNYCTLPTTRDAGMGVVVPSCHAWQIPRD